MSDAIVATSDSDLAAYWHTCGLDFIEASAVENPHRITFKFRDAAGVEPRLTRQFSRDTRLRGVLQSRRLLAKALHLARTSDSRRCSNTELCTRMSDQQYRTFERIATRSRLLRSVDGQQGPR